MRRVGRKRVARKHLRCRVAWWQCDDAQGGHGPMEGLRLTEDPSFSKIAAITAERYNRARQEKLRREAQGRSEVT